PGCADRRFGETGAASERRGARAGRDAGGQVEPGRVEARRGPGGCAGVDRRGARVPESAAARTDDHAAVVGRSGSAAGVLPYAARVGGGARAERTVDGDV